MRERNHVMDHTAKNATDLGAWLDNLHAWVNSLHVTAIAAAELAAAMASLYAEIELRTLEENDHG
jgi:hypothetical protein